MSAYAVSKVNDAPFGNGANQHIQGSNPNVAVSPLLPPGFNPGWLGFGVFGSYTAVPQALLMSGDVGNVDWRSYHVACCSALTPRLTSKSVFECKVKFPSLQRTHRGFLPHERVFDLCAVPEHLEIRPVDALNQSCSVQREVRHIERSSVVVDERHVDVR